LRDYEVLYIVRPDLEEDKVQDIVKRVNSLISRSGGSTEQTSLWGKRKLAYEVKHQKEGSYVLQDFTIDPGRVPELEAALKITEEVLRHLIVRKAEKPTPTAPAAPPPAEESLQPATAVSSGDANAADASDGGREER
jgi:small subunit ribosomal protein S6